MLDKIIVGNRKVNKQKPLLIISNRALILGVAPMASLFLSACNPDNASETFVPATDNSTTITQQKRQDIATLESNIKNSYARIAAEHSDICPKLLQKSDGQNTIERAAEVMVDDYCDYYLYPNMGQKITVSVDNEQIETLLIVPILHDFADGSYQVASYDKHVIRLSYNGATYKPERLYYDVAIKVID